MIALRHIVFAQRDLCLLLCCGLLLIGVPLMVPALSVRAVSTLEKKSYRVVVTVADVGAAGLVLSLNGQEHLPINGAGFFTFDTALRQRLRYSVAVANSPNDHSLVCKVSPNQGEATWDLHLTVLCTRTN